MRNTLIIFQKELKSYFASPIAYLLMAFFAVIFGFFFYSATRFFVLQGMQMQMMGRGMPMDVNEYVIRPLLSNASVIGLFLIPMITMRLYAEEKRSGTIELSGAARGSGVAGGVAELCNLFNPNAEKHPDNRRRHNAERQQPLKDACALTTARC